MYGSPGLQVVGTDEFLDRDGFDLALSARRRSRAWARRAHGPICLLGLAGRGVPGGERTVAPDGVAVVEGVRALHRMFRDADDVRVWVDGDVRDAP